MLVSILQIPLEKWGLSTVEFYSFGAKESRQQMEKFKSLLPAFLCMYLCCIKYFVYLLGKTLSIWSLGMSPLESFTKLSSVLPCDPYFMALVAALYVMLFSWWVKEEGEQSPEVRRE